MSVVGETIRNRDVPMERLLYEVKKVIVGQDHLLERLVVALLARGHLLVEGVPGLAKTLAVKTLGQVLGLQFSRIQFTPDLLPADLVGTLIFQQKTGEFVARKGPVFTNLLLADEINRAPAKVQSALLEAMQERQVTLGDTTYKLADPFLVLATQNPLEQEGTYQLPEAQLDRFMLKLSVGYPTKAEERKILDRILGGAGKRSDLEMLLELEKTQGIMPGTTICGLADGTAWATRTFINKFYDEFAARCPETRQRTAAPVITRGRLNVLTPMGGNTR